MRCSFEKAWILVSIAFMVLSLALLAGCKSTQCADGACTGDDCAACADKEACCADGSCPACQAKAKGE